MIYTDTPSVLVTFEGEPIYQKLEGTEIKRAVNTPYLMLLNPDDKNIISAVEIYGSALLMV